jgi:hypothetical protein
MFKHGFSSCFQKNNNSIYKSCIALAFGILLFLSGCGLTKSAELRAMENSVSIIQLTTGREVLRLLREKDWGFTGPIYPRVMIRYEPINRYTKKDVFDEIVTILEKSNWQKDEWSATPDSFSGSLRQDRYELSIGVTISSNENHVLVVIIIY